MVSEKMGLPFYRGGGRRRTVHNTNFLEKWLFSIIYCGKTIESIFMIFRVCLSFRGLLLCKFLHPTKLFNTKKDIENRDFRKSLYFYILIADAVHI